MDELTWQRDRKRERMPALICISFSPSFIPSGDYSSLGSVDGDTHIQGGSYSPQLIFSGNTLTDILRCMPH